MDEQWGTPSVTVHAEASKRLAHEMAAQHQIGMPASIDTQFTPSTDQVRAAYASLGNGPAFQERLEEFDRWLENLGGASSCQRPLAASIHGRPRRTHPPLGSHTPQPE